MSNHELQTIHLAFKQGKFCTESVYKLLSVLDDPASKPKEITMALRCVRLFAARGNNAPSNLKRRAAEALESHERRLAALKFCLAKKVVR